jgi:hypothetical protein
MIFLELLSEEKPYAGMSALEHQLHICEMGKRPNLLDGYVPEVIDTLLPAAWDPDLSKRLTMSQVCRRMLSFLMVLDVG